MQTYHYLLSFDENCESYANIKLAVQKILSLEQQKYMSKRMHIEQFLTYLDRYQEQFKNKSYFLLAFYMLGYINKSTSLIMNEYSEKIGFTGFNYEEIQNILHRFVFHEALENKILPSNFKQVLEKFYITFEGQDLDMPKIIDFLQQEYVDFQYQDILDKLVELFCGYLINDCLNINQNTNIVVTDLITKMQESLKSGISDVQLYQDDELDDMDILPITNYRIQKIPFFE